MSESGFTSNMELQFVDSKDINGQSSNVNSATSSSTDGLKQDCGSKTTRRQAGKRKQKQYRKVTEKRRRLDDKNTKAKAQYRRRIEGSSGDSYQDESQASSMFSSDIPLNAGKGRSCKKAVDFTKTVCLKGKMPSSTFIPSQSQLMTSKFESSSSFCTPDFPRKEVNIEVPDPVEEGIKDKGKAKKIKFLKDFEHNPDVNLGEKVLHSKEEIQVFLYGDVLTKKFNKVKNKRTVKMEKGKYPKIIGEARKILKNCDLNPYVNLGERVPHTKEKIRGFLYKYMFMKKFKKVKDKTVKIEKGKYIKVTGETGKMNFLKNCDLNPYVNLGNRVPHTKKEIQVFLCEEMPTRKGNKIMNKKTLECVEMKPKLSPLQKTFKAVLPEVSKPTKGTVKKKRITCQEKAENIKCSGKNFDLALSGSSNNNSFSGGDSKTLAELRASTSQNMKNESKKSDKSKLPDIRPKVGARENFNQPLVPKIPVSPASQASVSSKPDRKVTNRSAKANHTDKVRNEQKLFEASHVGNYHQIAKLLSLGVSIEVENLRKELGYFDSITPLQIAVRNGHVKCLEILIQHGANLDARNKYGCTALHLAAKTGNYLCLKMLLEARAAHRNFISSNILHLSDDSGATALHLAYQYNHEECAKILLQFGANCNAIDMMGYTPLHFAVKNRMLLSLEELMRHGANCNAVDVMGDNVLHFAVKRRRLSCIEELIKLGADCNAVDMMGDTPLHYVVRHRMLPFVKELIRLGANCNAVDLMGNTPLHFAVKYTMLSYVKELVHGRSDINFLNSDGLSPLHSLCQYSTFLPYSLDSWEDEEEKNEKKMEILKLLVLEGYNTDVNKTTSRGSNALSIAFKNFNFPVIKFLLSHGAYVKTKTKYVCACLDFELKAPDDDLDNIKCMVKCILQLPRLKLFNLFKTIKHSEKNFVKNAVCHDMLLPENLKYQFVQTATQVYVEMYNYELMTVPGDVRYPLQEPLLSLLYERVIDELKYRDKNSGKGNWYCFSHFCMEQLLLLRKQLWYEQIASTPRTLQHQCRIYIRKYVGPTNLKHIKKLSLPETMLSYLLFENDE